jgi:hypothetical protein
MQVSAAIMASRAPALLLVALVIAGASTASATCLSRRHLSQCANLSPGMMFTIQQHSYSMYNDDGAADLDVHAIHAMLMHAAGHRRHCVLCCWPLLQVAILLFFDAMCKVAM